MSVPPSQNTVFTIGHSNQPIRSFLETLEKYGVGAVADVRSVPYSRHAPQFSREFLEARLREIGIKYVFMGNELGARSDDPSCYVDGKVQYSRLADKDSFKAALDRIVLGSDDFRIAVMCTEKDPLRCHRSLLISSALEESGISVEHILPTGLLENHQESLNRLIREHFPSPSFFQSHDELLRTALSMQENRIAYVDRNADKTNKGATT